jgi:hypothetical protein
MAELMRIAWRTVGWICERVMAEQQAGRDRFGGLTPIGIARVAHMRTIATDLVEIMPISASPIDRR